MKMFVIDQDMKLWDIITKGPKVPMKKDAQGNDVVKSEFEVYLQRLLFSLPSEECPRSGPWI